MEPRSSWTSTNPGGSPLSGPVALLFIHHTGGGMPEGGVNAIPRHEQAVIRATREFHINHRGMSDIAYCYGFMPSGRTYVLRGHRTGGHTKFHNSISIAFVFFGSSDAVPRAAVDNAVREMGLERQVRVNKKQLTPNHQTIGHRNAEGAQTACPGNAINSRIKEIIEGGDDEMTDAEKKQLKEALEKAREAHNLADALREVLQAAKFGGAGRQAGEMLKSLADHLAQHPGGGGSTHEHGDDVTVAGPVR